LAVKRPQIRLLAYRSNFVGFYFPEFKHVGKFHLALSQALPGTGRPFYLLVVAPSRSTMDRVDAHVLSRVPPIHIFNPTAPPVVVDSIDLRTDSGKPSTWGKYYPTQRKPGRIEAAFALHKKSDADSIALPLVWLVDRRVEGAKTARRKATYACPSQPELSIPRSVCSSAPSSRCGLYFSSVSVITNG